MSWETILISAVGIILTALISWASERLIAFLNTKIKDAKGVKYLTDIWDIITRCVKMTYQTYVEGLKTDGKFDMDKQKEALDKAKDMALSQFTEEARDYIEANYGDIEAWLTSTIESIIYDLKNSSK